MSPTPARRTHERGERPQGSFGRRRQAPRGDVVRSQPGRGRRRRDRQDGPAGRTDPQPDRRGRNSHDGNRRHHLYKEGGCRAARAPGTGLGRFARPGAGPDADCGTRLGHGSAARLRLARRRVRPRFTAHRGARARRSGRPRLCVGIDLGFVLCRYPAPTSAPGRRRSGFRGR